MAQPRSKDRSTRDDEYGLEQREYRDKQGRVHHHTRNYMGRGGEASQSDERQERRRSSSPSRKRRSEPSDRGSSLGNLFRSIANRPGLPRRRSRRRHVADDVASAWRKRRAAPQLRTRRR